MTESLKMLKELIKNTIERLKEELEHYSNSIEYCILIKICEIRIHDFEYFLSQLETLEKEVVK